MECYEIGSVVRSARIRHGMTQEDLAFGICAVSTLSKIERGICSPKIGTFEALMERMGELPGRCILLVGEQELQRQRIQEEIALAIRLGAPPLLQPCCAVSAMAPSGPATCMWAKAVGTMAL